MDAPTGLLIGYLAVLFGTTAVALIVGLWWFATGEGERRLKAVLDARFGEQIGEDR